MGQSGPRAAEEGERGNRVRTLAFDPTELFVRSTQFQSITPMRTDAHMFVIRHR